MRKIIRAVLVLACLQTVTGCGGSGGSDGASSTAELAQGIYGGFASTGESLTMIVLSDGRFWTFYQSESVGAAPRGFIHGDGDEAGAVFTATRATDFNFHPGGIMASALIATVQPKSKLTGTLKLNNQEASFNAFYGQPAPVSNISGSYQLIVSGLTNGDETFHLLGSLTVNSSGSISGTTSEGCTVSGSAKPRGDINVHNLSLTLSGNSCPKQVSLDGIAYFEKLTAPTSSTQQMTGLLTSAARDFGFFFSAFSF